MIDDRAVSDSLGFVLVFGIIISTVAVVYVGGFASLDNARQYERMNNAERAFEVFADNVEDITQRGAPSRATEIKLAEASLYGDDVREITVNVTRHDQGDMNTTRTVQYQPLVYQSRTDTSNMMIYALGANFRSSSGGTVMMGEPTWVVGEDRIVIPIIQTVHSGGTITGSKTTLVRTTASRTEILTENTTKSSDVYINMTTPRAEAWGRYLEEQSDAMSCTVDTTTEPEEVECEIKDVETVYVTRIVVNYEFL